MPDLSDKRLKVLIEAGADVDAKTNTGWTILYVASRLGHSEVVKVGPYSRESTSPA